MKEYAILLDTTYCTGCNTCAYKCIQEFRDQDQAASGLFRAFVQMNDEGMYQQRCMHCKDPQCVKACTTGALTTSGYGPVLFDAAKCIGDKKCVAACPFHAIQFNTSTAKIVKCSMCAHRLSRDKEPACVEACPSGALQFGEYDKLLETAKTTTSKGKLQIYGLKENGGTHMIILLKEEPGRVGYPTVAVLA
ncbi:MAG: 4Fe-4S binding protein [Nitrospirae bacterium]|nr:4Fe-4S binding protein [Nitrospirota bacterium]